MLNAKAIISKSRGDLAKLGFWAIGITYTAEAQR